MRIVWLSVGWVFFGLGIIGAVLPVVPTVPFLLVAVWAFSRSSPHWRDKILHDPRFGPPIRHWQERGAIRRPIKFWATVMMACGVAWSLWLQLPPVLIATQALVCTAIAVFVITRPES